MSQSTSEYIGYEWVMARFAGEQAKHVMGLADQGVGYMILDKPDKGAAWCVAAFRRPAGAPKAYLQPVTSPSIIKRLEERFVPSLDRRKA